MFDVIPSWFGTFFIGDFFTGMLVRPLLEDAWSALRLRTLLMAKPPRALLLGTFLGSSLPDACDHVLAQHLPPRRCCWASWP